MSVADTAEYQLEQLAETMTEMMREADAVGWRNPDYKDGFMDALSQVADDMGITITTTTAYTYP